MAEFFQEEAHLEVADRVGGHHQFQGVEVLENVLANEVFLAAAAVLGFKLGNRLLGGLGHEGHGARCGIEQRHALRGEAVAQTEGGLEHAVQGANNVADDWFGGVVDAAPLALVGVVLRQKCLVEMHDRVAALALPVVATEDAGAVGHGQDLGEIVHAPGERFRQIAQRNEAKHVTQDADSVGNVVESGAAIEAVPGADASREKTVGDGLREQVGERLRRQRADEVFPEGVKEAAQHAGVIRFVVVLVSDDIPEQARAFGQLDGEGLGGERLGQGKIEEARKED